jgi:hypothetical protein
MEADLSIPIKVSQKKLILIGKLNFKIVIWGCRITNGDDRILFNHSFSHGYVISKPGLSKHNPYAQGYSGEISDIAFLKGNNKRQHLFQALLTFKPPSHNIILDPWY